MDAILGVLIGFYLLSTGLALLVAIRFTMLYWRTRVHSSLIITVTFYGLFLFSLGFTLNFFSTSYALSALYFSFIAIGIISSQYALSVFMNMLRFGRLDIRALWFSSILMGILLGLVFLNADEMIYFESNLTLYFALIPDTITLFAFIFFFYQLYSFIVTYREIKQRVLIRDTMERFRLLILSSLLIALLLGIFSIAGYFLDLPILYFANGIPTSVILVGLLIAGRSFITKGRLHLTPQNLFHVIVFNRETRTTVTSKHFIEYSAEPIEYLAQSIPGIASMVEEAVGHEREIQAIHLHSRNFVFRFQGKWGICCIVDEYSHVFFDLMERFLALASSIKDEGHIHVILNEVFQF